MLDRLLRTQKKQNLDPGSAIGLNPIEFEWEEHERTDPIATGPS